MFNELDVVALTRDILPDPKMDMPAEGMKAGELGAIVFVYGKNEAFEVEFVAEDGYTTALLTLYPADIRLVQSYAPEPSRVEA